MFINSFSDRWEGGDLGRERNRGSHDKGGSPNRWGDSNRGYFYITGNNTIMFKLV
jgi:hypothetical protein